MSERVIIKPGSIILWFKPTLWQRLFGRKKEYEYNYSGFITQGATEERVFDDIKWTGKIWPYMVLSPRKPYNESELVMLDKLRKNSDPSEVTINQIRPGTFKENTTVFDALNNPYYKVVLLGDKRNRTVTNK